MQKIIPHLWFDTQAKEACEFYVTVFPNSKINSLKQIHDTPSGDCDIVSISLNGFEVMAISAGPHFTLTPALSFVVPVNSAEEVDALYEKLSPGGMDLMPLDTYDFSPRYAWVQDRFGVNWQLMCTDDESQIGKIIPAFMFIGDNYLKGKEAMEYYTSLFEKSSVDLVVPYGEAAQDFDKPEAIMHGRFTLAGQQFWLLESGYDHKFTFNEAFSLMIMCEDQDEIDTLWDKLSAHPENEQCGWIKDKYGVSWQIIPKNMEALTSSDDAVQAMLKMKKIDIAELEKFSGKN